MKKDFLDLGRAAGRGVMSTCKDCRWWGRHIVGANFSDANKRMAICDDPMAAFGYAVVAGNLKTRTNFFTLWTYEDFGCKHFEEQP